MLRFPPRTARRSRLTGRFLCPSSGIGPFSGELLAPASERDAENRMRRRRGQRRTAVPGASLRPDRLQARVKGTSECVCVRARVHTYVCLRIHLRTYLKLVRTDTADLNPTPKLYASVLPSAFVMSTSEREEAAPHYA